MLNFFQKKVSKAHKYLTRKVRKLYSDKCPNIIMHFNILRCQCPSHQLTTDIKIRILVNKIKTEQRKLKKLQKNFLQLQMFKNYYNFN